MAIFRNVYTTFWTDTKVTEEYSPEDKYFMLYCLTNPKTNIIGCYEISVRQMAIDLGYSKDCVENLLKRFAELHKTIVYDFDTKELFIKNWGKYNWSASPKLDVAIRESLQAVKSDIFRAELADLYNSRDTVSIPYVYGSDTSSIYIISNITKIINYLNTVLSTRYGVSNKATQRHIRARLNEGFTFNDFKEVIDKKYAEWNNTDMAQYLRPETLFGTKFESYLNSHLVEKKPKQNVGNKYADLA